MPSTRNRDRDLQRTLALAKERPSDVHARMEAAYACDYTGDEHGAILHYEAAWALGVPEAERREFLVGYGSTLRNVGRVEESIALLSQAAIDFGDYAPLKLFLALSLQAGGHGKAAVATLLNVVLDLAQGSDALDGYERALGYYQRELLDQAIQPKP